MEIPSSSSSSWVCSNRNKGYLFIYFFMCNCHWICMGWFVIRFFVAVWGVFLVFVPGWCCFCGSCLLCFFSCGRGFCFVSRCVVFGCSLMLPLFALSGPFNKILLLKKKKIVIEYRFLISGVLFKAIFRDW